MGSRKIIKNFKNHNELMTELVSTYAFDNFEIESDEGRAEIKKQMQQILEINSKINKVDMLISYIKKFNSTIKKYNGAYVIRFE